MHAVTIVPVEMALPFDGWWQVVRGPADRVPSHGTDRFGLTYAYDFVAVDERDRTRSRHRWRRALWTEAVDQFVGFGRPVLAPVAGTVVAVHDGVPDGRAHRSPLSQLAMLVAQARRLRAGHDALAGNHVIVQAGRDAFVVLAHLRCGSIRVHVGDQVAVGDPIGECGNSGNSTEPHLHLQAMESADPDRARGLPLRFTSCEVREGEGRSRLRTSALPRARETVRRR